LLKHVSLGKRLIFRWGGSYYDVKYSNYYGSKGYNF